MLAGIVIVAPSPYGVPLPNDAVFQPVNVKLVLVKPEPLLRVTGDPERAYDEEIVPVPLFALYVMVLACNHFANNITGAVIAKVSPAEYVVPVPFALVFHPSNT